MAFAHCPKPTPSPMATGSIAFHHPGFNLPTSTLLWLGRVDLAPDGRMGVHFGTAHAACAIVAANAFDGFLALDREGRERVELHSDAILLEPDYFFFAGPDAATATDYAVVPTFRDWEFPHGRMPAAWQAAQRNHSRYDGQSSRCALSHHAVPLDVAHIVPRAETDWFYRNNLSRYGQPEIFCTIDDQANTFSLRCDIHRIFDARTLAFVPKGPLQDSSSSSSCNSGSGRGGGPADESPVFVAHLLGSAIDDYHAVLHNAIPQYLHTNSTEFLFARFAWTVIFGVKQFLVAGFMRKVHVAVVEPTHVSYMVKELTGTELRDAYGGGGSTDVTPLKKRKRGAEGDEDNEDDSSSSDSGTWDSNIWDSGLGPHSNCPRRSRRPAQQSSDETVADMDDRTNPAVDRSTEEALRNAVAPIVLEMEAQYE